MKWWKGCSAANVYEDASTPLRGSKERGGLSTLVSTVGGYSAVAEIQKERFAMSWSVLTSLWCGDCGAFGFNKDTHHTYTVSKDILKSSELVIEVLSCIDVCSL